jgi:hypothetical protein
VTQGVVDGLEVIEIEIKNGELVLLPANAQERIAQARS